MSHRRVAATVREHKEKHPDQYCPVGRCLWKTGGGHCPRHTVAAAAPKPIAEPGQVITYGRTYAGKRTERTGTVLAAHDPRGCTECPTWIHVLTPEGVLHHVNPEAVTHVDGVAVSSAGGAA